MPARVFQVWAIMADRVNFQGVYEGGISALAERMGITRGALSDIINDPESGLIKRGLIRIYHRNSRGTTFKVRPLPTARWHRPVVLDDPRWRLCKTDTTHAPLFSGAEIPLVAGDADGEGMTEPRPEIPARTIFPAHEKTDSAGKIVQRTEIPAHEKTDSAAIFRRTAPEISCASRPRGELGITSVPNSDPIQPRNIQTTTTLERFLSEPEPSSSSSRICSLPEQDCNELAREFTDATGPMSMRGLLAEFSDAQIATAIELLRVMEPGELKGARVRAALVSGWTFAANPNADLLARYGVARREGLCRKFSTEHIVSNVHGKLAQFKAWKRPDDDPRLPAAIFTGIMDDDAKPAREKLKKQAAVAAQVMQKTHAETRSKADEARRQLEEAENARRERASNRADFEALAPRVLAQAIEEFIAAAVPLEVRGLRDSLLKSSPADFAANPRRAAAIRAIANAILNGDIRRVPVQESA